MSPKRITRPLDIYIRVSDVRGRAGESFISPKDQEERCRALAKARGYKIGDVFTDLDVSGGKMRRPELDKAISRIEQGVSAGIIVAKLDRFSRTLVGGLQTLEQINNLGGAVIIADGEFDTSTATGELVLNMMLSLAQFELRRIRETWASSKRHAVENGVHISRHVPPGYVRGPDRILMPHPKHGETLEEAFAMAARGESYTRIANYLTDRKLPIGGKRSVWEANRVRRLLANRVYLGEARSGHGDINEHAHDPLVDRETFLRAQRSNPAPELTQQVDNLLAGLCRCASCSYSMRSQQARGDTIAVYRCRTTSVNGRCPQPTTISQQRLEEYVLQAFLARHNMPLVASDEPDEEESALVQAAIDAEASYRQTLTNVELRSVIGDTDHDRMIAALHTAMEEAQSRIIPTTRRAPAVATADIAELVQDLRQRGEILDLRQLLATAIQGVFVRPAASRSHSLPIMDRVHIVWMDDPPLELPKRGSRFEPRAFTWS